MPLNILLIRSHTVAIGFKSGERCWPKYKVDTAFFDINLRVFSGVSWDTVLHENKPGIHTHSTMNYGNSMMSIGLRAGKGGFSVDKAMKWYLLNVVYTASDA